jgi:hypothetical protein
MRLLSFFALVLLLVTLASCEPWFALRNGEPGLRAHDEADLQ